MFVLVHSTEIERPTMACGQNMQGEGTAELTLKDPEQQNTSTTLMGVGQVVMKSCFYQAKAFFPGLAHLHGSLNFPVCAKNRK